MRTWKQFSETLRTSQQYGTKGFKGSPPRAPIMPRGVSSLTTSGNKSFQFVDLALKLPAIIVIGEGGVSNLTSQESRLHIHAKLTGIRLYLPFSDWFRTKRNSVWCHINRKMVNTMYFRFDSIRFRKYFSVCGFVNSRNSCHPNIWEQAVAYKGPRG